MIQPSRHIRSLAVNGQIVLPVDVRRALGITENTDVEMYAGVDENGPCVVIALVVRRGCLFCGSKPALPMGRNQVPICGSCRRELDDLVEAASERHFHGKTIGGGGPV